MSLLAKVNRDLPHLQTKIVASVQYLLKTLTDFNYEKEEVYLSFNGGKDCALVLYLLEEAVVYLASKTEMSLSEVVENQVDLTSRSENGELAAEVRRIMSKINLVYFTDDEFDEVKAFVEGMSKKFQMNLVEFSGNVIDALTVLVEKQNLKAIIMGNRHSDPYSNDLSAFTASSEGWPTFMRIFPILRWELKDIWDIYLAFELDICVLYKRGYASLGKKSKTKQNPHLITKEGDYLPAHSLVYDELERVGR